LFNPINNEDVFVAVHPSTDAKVDSTGV